MRFITLKCLWLIWSDHLCVYTVVLTLYKHGENEELNRELWTLIIVYCLFFGSGIEVIPVNYANIDIPSPKKCF